MRPSRALVVIAFTAWSCSKAHPREGEIAHPVNWQEQIGALFAANCNECHSGNNPSAGYRTTSYLDALGPTSAPVAVPGHADSKILSELQNANHGTVAGTYDQVHAWVVDGKVAYSTGGVHEPGNLNPNDPYFHKYLVRDAGWNFAQCQHCHGADLSGGTAGVSCQECHAFQVAAGGVPTCVTCHGNLQSQSPAPPRDLAGDSATTARGVGAHQAHLFGKVRISAPLSCDTCHVVPAQIASAGHLDHLRPAIVTFSGRALSDGAQPVWNGTSCSATYCHGGGAKLSTDTAALLQKPAWTKGSSQNFCGSCHGAPPGDNVHRGIFYPDCARCHANTVTSNGIIILSGPPDAPTSTHINGVIDVTP